MTNSKKNSAKKRLVKLSPTLYADKGTYDKVHLHLTDINDTISEEDISNVSTDIVPNKIHEAARRDQAALIKKLNVNKPGGALSEKEEKEMYDEGEKITSPWNILSE